MRFQNILVGVAAVALGAGVQAEQVKPKTAPATQPAGTVPDEATAKTAVQPDQAQPAQTQPAQTQPTATDQTSATTSASADASASQVKAATAADVKSGVEVYDQKGGRVGKVESVSAKGAVINTGTARASIPVSSFAKNDKGLVLAMTKTELETAAKKKSPK